MKSESSTKNLLPVDGNVMYYGSFFSEQECSSHFDELFRTIDWQTKSIKLFGRTMDQPRMMAWYGDDGANYSYSNLRLTPSSWTPALRIIKVNVEKHLGIPFNSALLNLYRDGNDSMGAHRDNEKELGEHPFIASVSFGCVRNFFLHHIHDKGLKINLLLENGSLLVMKGATQNFWKHGIKKTKAADNPRINITFRKIIS